MPNQAKAKLYLALGKATVKLIQSKDEPSDADLAICTISRSIFNVCFLIDRSLEAELKATRKFLDKFADR